MDSSMSFYERITKYRMALFGLATIWIYFRHIYFFNIESYGFIDYMTQLGDCGVDIFLFLSGFGCYYSFKKNGSLKEFYTRRAIRILPTILILFPIFSLVKSFFCETPVIQIFNPLYYILSVYSAFWYVGAIVLYYLAFPLIYKWMENKTWSCFLIIYAACVIGVFVVHQADKSLLTPLVLYFARFPVFILGAIFAKDNSLFNKRKLILLGFIMSIPFFYCIPKDYQRFLYIFLTLAFVTYFPYIFDMIPKYGIAIISRIGIASLEFYLIHVFLFANKFVNESLQTGGVFLFLVLTTLISSITQIIISRIQQKLKKNLLGKDKR